MIDKDILVRAIEAQNMSLFREIELNRILTRDIDRWVNHINLYIKTAKQFFDLVEAPSSELVYDPETGNPYVVVEIYANGTIDELHNQYKKCISYVVENSDKLFMFREKVVFDVNLAHLLAKRSKNEVDS